MSWNLLPAYLQRPRYDSLRLYVPPSLPSSLFYTIPSCIVGSMLRNKVLIIVGPTASGKSALAVWLARKYNGEVVSADSRQVYRGLNIGTAKITRREMLGVAHHLLDVASAKHTFTAYNFAEHARMAIKRIVAHKKLAIVAGGTGFYIDALTGRITLPNVPANTTLRTRLEKKTVSQLFSILKKHDLRRALTIEPDNKRRLIRALEIAQKQEGSPLPSRSNPYDSLWIGLASPESQLDKKITMRLFARIRQGMVAEARLLHRSGLSYKRMGELGLEYRSLARFLQGKITREQMGEEMSRGSRRYAKRQLRYWKRNRLIHWFRPSQKQEISRVVKDWLTRK